MKVYIAVFTHKYYGVVRNKVYATRELAERGVWIDDGVVDEDLRLVDVEEHEVEDEENAEKFAKESVNEEEDTYARPKDGWDGIMTPNPNDLFR